MKRYASTKSFRIIDFAVYDEQPNAGGGGGEDENSGSENAAAVAAAPAYSPRQFIIEMFGLDEKGKTCSIKVTDFKPFFYVKVYDNWTEQDTFDLCSLLKRMTNQQRMRIQGKIVEHKKLYGFDAGKKYKFVKLEFSTTRDFSAVKSLWYKKKGTERQLTKLSFKKKDLEIYESCIPPLLRYFHIENISPSGWVKVPLKTCVYHKPTTTVATAEESENDSDDSGESSKSQSRKKRKTTCDYEFVCLSSNIKPLADKETRVPYKICSFDIEASSSHGDFPVPKKTYKRLAANIVDNLTGVENVQQIETIIKSAIQTAFGYGCMADVDLVYPKVIPSQQLLQKLIKKLLSYGVDSNAASGGSGGKSRIDSMFDKISRADYFAGGVGGAGKGDDGEGEEDADGGCADDTAVIDFEVYESEEENEYMDDQEIKSGAAAAAGAPAPVTYTITQILAGETKTAVLPRDEKIQLINYLLTEKIGFPELEGDKVTFIGSTFMTYGEKEPYKNHCVVLGSCDPVDGAIIESVDTEYELLMRWKQLIVRENPDIIIGYNIFGFDYEFLFRRAEENHCVNEFLEMTRKIGEKSGKVNFRTDRIEDIEHTSVVLASGEYDLKYFKMTGRLQIDMYTYMRRDYNLPSYKLDDIAGQFIGDDIKKIVVDTEKNVTELYTSNITGLHVGDYIHIEITGFTTDYYGEKHKIVDIFPPTEEIKNTRLVIRGAHTIPTGKNIRWGLAKDDVSPQDIFRLANEGAASRAIVAKYCIQDCNLVHHLLNKIDVITGYIEMSRICSVPISFLVFRGQGIKLTSYVAKKCREKDTLLPDLPRKSGGDDGYEGAIVLPPKCSMYFDNPVACVDYASLYPSSMISENLSHDSKVWTKEYDREGRLIKVTGERNAAGDFIYDNLPEYEYVDVEFDTYKYIRPTPTSRAVKTKYGKMVCRWAQYPNGQKAIMPSILEELLKARSDTRKMAKTVSDPFMQNILDKRQLGYKVTANSLYGQCGAQTSTFYEKDIAASTTATGRKMITYAKRIIEEVYGGGREYKTQKHDLVLTNAEYVYGDSVADYTPVIVRHCEKIGCYKIEDLPIIFGGEWKTRDEKEVCILEKQIETWTENGWTTLSCIIRHKLAHHKKMIRILTHTGLVDVTDDHSLLLTNKEEISPKDVSIGTELLHSKLPISNNGKYEITEEEAQIMGFFFGDGSCGSYNCKSGKKNSWALNNSSLELIDKYLNLCKNVYSEYDWVVMDTLKSSGVYKLSPRTNKYGFIKTLVDKYRTKLYCDKSKIIPIEILNSSYEIKEAFMKGLYDADGDKCGFNYRIDQKNQLSAAHICILANSLGYNTSINTRKDKENIYRITMTKKQQRKNPNSIKKMHEIFYDNNRYVYDLTTENHHFAAGVGNLIVHNTDSVFFTFNLEDPQTHQPIRGKKALEITIEIAQEVAGLCTKFLKAPMELAYEKTLMPFILLSKKRYVGMLYETDPNKGKLKYMGLSLKRRDSCDYLKDTYGNIIQMLMAGKNIEEAIQYLNTSMTDLIQGKVPIEKLILTRSLRSDYKNPLQIAHKVLADRIGKRDPGNKPKSGDRIKFAFIEHPNSRALLGERIETPEFIEENRLKIDYNYYITNQLMKPIQQLFGLALEKIYEMRRKETKIRDYKMNIRKLQRDFPDIEVFMKKREILCSKEIKTLIFDAIISKIHNERARNTEITKFYK